MENIFNAFCESGRGSALVDWTVLLAGMILMCLTVASVVTAQAEEISGGASDRAASARDWLPS